MYRVYDKKEKVWVKDGIYLSPNDDLSTSKKSIFGNHRMSLVSDQRYVLHRDIGSTDVNNVLIYEGDIVEVENEGNLLVVYTSETASFILLNFEDHTYLPLGTLVCNKFVKVIGNIFDNRDLLPEEAYEGSEFID